MMKKCKGCGVELQTNSKEEYGYTVDLERDLCYRCFRIKNYNEYQMVEKPKEEYEEILRNIDQRGDLILFVADFFLWSDEVVHLLRTLKSPTILLLSKRDIMPYSLKEEKIQKYIEDLNLPIVDMELISSHKNFHLDALLEKMEKYKKSSFVYVVGFTNAGKSTLINKMIYNYSKYDTEIITSIMPSTTLDILEVPLKEDLILMDTPGLLMSRSMMNEVDGKMLAKILPKKEIKPIMYPLKENGFVYIEDLVGLQTNAHVTFYMSNALSIQRTYQSKISDFSYSHVIEVGKEEDLVIEGLGFIKVSQKTTVKIYLKYDVAVYTRKTILGGKLW